MDIAEVIKLDGKIVAMLNQDELKVLNTAHEQGRKLGINLSITCENKVINDIPRQLKSIVAGYRSSTVWCGNSIIHVNTQQN